jgi:hypothetical protein
MMIFRNVCLSTVLFFISITSVQSFNLFFNDWFGNNDSILFAKIRCFLALRRLNFNTAAFDRYTTYFRDDSVMELAQTGVYMGADNIEEYIKFAFADFSPYISNFTAGKTVNEFIGYDNGQCVFTQLRSITYVMDPNTTDAPEPYDVAFLLKLYLDFEQRYLSRINVFYTDDFMRVYFDKFLNSVPTRNLVCNVMQGPCLSILNATYDNNNVTCATMLNELPSTDSTKYYVDGKSQGCRALHAVFAETNPTNHCAHLSFTPLQDPSGNIKCQSSKNKLPSELFTANEIQIFESFAESVGIDPIKGHTSNE